jgi:periplasmic divalent cation tolerance protein
MEQVVLMLTTTNSEEQAVKIAEGLVQKGLVACVNIVKKIRSIYRFKGEVWDDEECLLLIKTRESLKENVEEAIRGLHTYELPEILCLPLSHAEPHFQQWILDSTVTPAE